MPRDVANARVYSDGDVWVAPLATAMPATPTATPNVAFKVLGWISDEGLTETRSVSTTDINAWQKGVLVRRVKSTDSRTFKVQCLEENAVVLGLERPGSTPSTTTGITTTAVKASTSSDIRAFIVDVIDGTVHTRKMIPTGEVTSGGDVVYKNGEITIREFEITAYPDSTGTIYTELTDSAGAAVA